jgi:hypothetical protein
LSTDSRRTRLPKRGEVVTIGDQRFRVVRADSRRLYTLQVEPAAPAAPPVQPAPTSTPSDADASEFQREAVAAGDGDPA